MNQNFIAGIKLAQDLIKQYPRQKEFYLSATANEADSLIHAMVLYMEACGKKVNLSIYWISSRGPAYQRYAEPSMRKAKHICILTTDNQHKNYVLIGESQSIMAHSREIIFFKQKQVPKEKIILPKTKMTKSNLKIIESSDCKISTLVRTRRELFLC